MRLSQFPAVRLRAAAVAALLLASGAAAAQTASPAAAPAQAPEPIKPPYVVADAATGEVLDHYDALRPWYPASTTKLMTAYVAFQAVRSGRLRMDLPVVVSKKALAQPPSKMGFRVGTELTLDDALKILMVKSANDIAMAVAETIGGSQEGFAELMNAEAQRLRMWRSHFVNPHGLPDTRQVTSARDMALLGRALLRDFPEYRDYLRIPAIQLGDKIMRNYNTLIERYPGATGMKTGFICSSGYNLVASAQRDGREVIAVVFGSMNGKARGEQAAALLNAGLESHTLARTHRTNLANVASGITYREPFDMRPVVCPDRKQAVAAADNPETDAATAEATAVQTAAAADGNTVAERKEAAAPLLGPRFFVGPPVAIHPNVPPKGSTVAARPGPLPRARPPFAPDFSGSDVANAFVPAEETSGAAAAVSSVIGVPTAPLPRARPPR